MLDVAALGELLIDFTCLSTDENGYPTMAAHPGGAPANFLAALAKYGAKTAMLGKVGDDTFGHLLLDTLRRAGIETRGMIAAPDVFTTVTKASVVNTSSAAASPFVSIPASRSVLISNLPNVSVPTLPSIPTFPPNLAIAARKFAGAPPGCAAIVG